ncbi:MAG TPA: hypothetical protein VK427_23455 [Kofleriaceae bacterium]|nr:hypothetical protein [Kofleriaceae bacterium]
MLTKSLLAATAAFSLVACVKHDDAPSDLKTALPTADQVRIKLPEGTSRTVGQLAAYYTITRDVTRTFNGGSAWVLVLLHSIVAYPVTSVNGDVYTWGPWSGALDPAEYKLDVIANGDGTYEYELSGRNKTAPNAAFEMIITGYADPRPGQLRSKGVFNIDFDAAGRVNPVGSANRGEVTVTYDLATRHLDLDLVGVDEQNKPLTAQYAYDEAADGAGKMSFGAKGDAGGGSQHESFQIVSRWLATGTGRADVSASGGDIQSQVTVSLTECWDPSFRRTYYQDSANFAPTEGSAASCIAK